MRAALIATAAVLLAGCPYRTEVYRSNAALYRKDASGMPEVGADGQVVFGTQMHLAKAQDGVIDLATLARDCDSGVVAAIDEIRTIGGLNIFTGSRRSLEVWCGVVGGAAPAPAP